MKPSQLHVAVVLALAYPIILLGSALAIMWIGEGWWATTLALYAPRVLFALPLPMLVSVLVWRRMWRLLWTQAIAALILVFSFFGFVLPLPRALQAGQSLRVLSYNANSCRGGVHELAAEILGASADVVLVQELFQDSDALGLALKPYFREVRSAGQFLIATRFPIVSELSAEELPALHWPAAAGGVADSARFLRDVVDTPLGRIAFYNFHPLSPRDGFDEFLGSDGVLTELRSGHLSLGAGPDSVQTNSDVRAQQVRTLASFAAHEKSNVVIAGDTNLPGLSPLLRTDLGPYRDGFRVASWGFGYTYPVRFPWMRIDRILADPKLDFISFRVGCGAASNHRCVVAELVNR